MKKFTDLLSPLSWLFLFLAVYLGLIILFQPSLKEIGILIIVDHLAIIPAALFEQTLFSRWHPDTKTFFPEVKLDEIRNMTNQQKISLYTTFTAFPEQRAKHILLGSVLKVIPAALIVSFIWKHQGSNFNQLAKFMVFELIMFTALYGIMYTEFQDLCSREIKNLHLQLDWSDVFQKAPIPKQKKELYLPENLSLIFIAVWWILLSSVFIYSDPTKSGRGITLEIIAIGTVAFLLLGRIYFLNRKHYRQGLEQIFNTFESLTYGNTNTTLPMHSSPLLARFEKTFNELTVRLKAREKEISNWVDYEMEQSRYRALGEISGLIAHDLATPLHVVQFCSEELAEAVNQEAYGTHIDQLRTNLRRARELVDSLRTYLKNPAAHSSKTAFLEAHSSIQQILNTQFRDLSMPQKIQIQVDPSLAEVSLAVPRVDLTQILYNLYKNSIENLLLNSIEGASLQVSLVNHNEREIEVSISDNGTGLSPQRFLKMTSHGIHNPWNGYVKEGLGLRLATRLVERNGGRLMVKEPSPAANGTCFALRLPVASESILSQESEAHLVV